MGAGSPAIRGEGRHVLAADVRLDNRPELLSALNLAHPSRLPDQELLLECLLAWGLSCLDRLVGDFAFAWWDRDGGSLVLARDYIGQRPLHYAARPGLFGFASMPAGLHALPRVERRPSTLAAARFVRQQPGPPSDGFFDGICQLPPGYLAIVRNGEVGLRRWWRYEPPAAAPASLEDCALHARALLDQAVASRVVDGGPIVATHLSAGLDSSGVAATAAPLVARDGRALVAFTAVPQHGPIDAPPHAIADEGRVAATIAAANGIEHVAVPLAGSLRAVFERNVALWERPVPNPFNDLWWCRIAELAAARGASVLLTAPMGNIGLSQAGFEHLPGLLARGRWRAWAQAAAAVRREHGLPIGASLRSSIAPFLPHAAWRLARNVRRGPPPPDFLTFEGRRLACDTRSQLDRAPRCALQRRLTLIATTDPGPFNAGLAAGFGIEARDPSSDRRLVEFTLGLPASLYFNRGEGRALARRALADRLPASVVEERRKGYQSADWYRVLLGDRDWLIEEARAIAGSAAGGIIDGPAIVRALERMPGHGWGSNRVRQTYEENLVRALAAAHFMRSR